MSSAGAVWTDLGDGVLVRQSVAFAMNSVVLLDPERAVIVDPGILPSELDNLARIVGEPAPEAITLFFTHAHWDHVLGRPWWPSAETLAHDRFAAEVRADRDTIVREAAALAATHGEGWEHEFTPFKPDLAVSGLRFLRLDPWRLVLRDAPGHSSSQLTCHLTDLNILIAADMLSDIEPPILDGPCGPYRETLEHLRVLAEHGAIETLIPGHGRIAEGHDEVLARFQTDLDYLTALERAVQEAIGRGETLATAQETLATMDYTGRGSTTTPTDTFHRENIRFAYQAAGPPRP
jgi:glyoxylase-like metal-dependent hydrolase (beta-lactamase superfamily II)